MQAGKLCLILLLPHLLRCTLGQLQGRQLEPPFPDVLPPIQYISWWGSVAEWGRLPATLFSGPYWGTESQMLSLLCSHNQ